MINYFITAKKFVRATIVILLIFALSFGFFWVLDYLLNPPIKVIAEFSELGPFYKSMPVYYKGYKIGKTGKVHPSKDFKATLVTIIFYPEELKLPENVNAKVKQLSNGIDYISIEYPKNPSAKMLKTGQVIQGSSSLDIQSFMNSQIESGMLGSITMNIDSTLVTFSKAGEEATKLLQTLTLTVNENRPAIKATINNLYLSSEKIQNLTEKLDNAVSSEKMNSSITNIDKTISNAQEITKDIQNATKDLDKTIQYTNSALCQLNGAAANINEITKSIKETLNKNMGMMKLFFGKPVNSRNCR